MAGNIKGITIEIGGNTSQLQQALSDVSKKGKDLQTELRDINKLLKLDPSNTALLAQKQKVLAEVVENTKKKLETLKTAQEQAKQQLNNGEIGEEQYRALERQVVETEQSLDRLEGQAREVDAALDAAGNAGQEAANDIRQVGDASSEAGSRAQGMSATSAASFATMTAAVSAVIQKVIELCEKLKDAALSAAVWADDMNTLSAQTHVSTEALQKFAYASDLIDVSVDTFAGSMGKLTKNMDKAAGGTKAQKEAFEALGVSVTDSNGELRNAEDVFYEVIDALGQMENETEADALANAVFGRSFQDLNPLVSAGTDKLKELGDEAMRTGYVMSQDALDASNSLQDSLDRLKNMTEMSKRSFSQGLAPALDKVVQKMNKGLASPKVQASLKKLGEAIGEIVEAFAEFVGFLVDNGEIVLTVITSIAAGFAAWKITTILQAAIPAIASFVTSFVTGAKSVVLGIESINKASLGSIIGAIAALVVAIIQVTDHFLGASDAAKDFKDDAESINDTAQGLADEFTKTSETLSINADKARTLATEISDLDAKINSGSLSTAELAAAQSLLKAKTIEYNTAVGEEVLKINEATGAIEGGTEALADNTEALIENAKKAAEIEALKKAFEAQTEAQAQTAAGLLQIKSHYDELSDSQKELIDDMERNGVTSEKLTDLWWASYDATYQVNNEIRTFVEGMEDSMAAEEAAGAQIEVYTAQMEENAVATAQGTEATQEQTAAVEDLTAAEALRLLRAQENGDQLSELQQQQLEAYRANNEEQYVAMEELVAKEQEFAAARLEVIRNTNEAIELEYDLSLEQRLENQNKNIELWDNYEKNLATLRLQAAAIQNEEDRAAMESYIEVLSDGTAESMAIAQQGADAFVDTSSNAGRDAFMGLARNYYSTLDKEKPKMVTESNKTGKDVVDATAKGVKDNTALKGAATEQITGAAQAMNSSVESAGFNSTGIRMVDKIISGINGAKGALMGAVGNIVSQVNSMLHFTPTVSVNGKGSTGKTRGFATGGVVYNREIVQVAESGAEAIIPLNRMGDIVNGILSRARGADSGIGNGTVYVQPQITINAQRLTQAELDRCAEYTSRAFSRVLGGKMR